MPLLIFGTISKGTVKSLIPPDAGLFTKIQSIMFEIKSNNHKSPDLSKLKEVIIDHRTRIYIAPEADVEEARSRYMLRNTAKRLK